MTLPANDAFSLGLAHDQRRSRTPSIPRRSTSPKFLFSSPSPSARGMSPSKTSHRRKHGSSHGSQNNIRSSGSEATIEELAEEADARSRTSSPVAAKRKSKHASADSAPNGVQKPNPTKNTIDWEIPRKALHSSIGFFTIYLYTSNGNPQHVIVALSSALAILIPIDVLRLRYPSFEYAFEKCVGIFMRDNEKKSSNGVIWYILGVNAVLVALPLDIAVVSVLILSWADTAASTFGRLYGSRTPPLPKRLLGVLPLAPRKSLAGFIAASLTGAAIATSFWAWLAPLRPHSLTWTWQDGVSQSFIGGSQGLGSTPVFVGWVGLLTIGVFAGLVTGVAEALDLGGVDDNLSLPVIAGGCIWGLFKVLGWLGGLLA